MTSVVSTPTPEFEESFTAVNGASVRVLQAGEGEPLLLLSGSQGLTRGQALLAGMCRVMALDPPDAHADAVFDQLIPRWTI